MKGLKKVALASAIAAVSAGAQAELKALDDSAMGELTGQAGLTIDIETKWSIGEFMYKDAGSVLISGISMGGNTNASVTNADGTGTIANTSGGSYLDNIRLTLDIAGADTADNASLNYGFSEIGRLTAFVAGTASTDTQIGANALAVATGGQATDFTTGLGADVGVGQWVSPSLGGGFAQTATLADFGGNLLPIDASGNLAVDTSGNPIAPFTSENGSDAAGVEDGDLVIHWGFTDAFDFAGGYDAVAAGEGSYDGNTAMGFADITWANARDIATRAVDFNFNIDSISLADSTYVAGDLYDNTTSAQTTTLISGLNMRGYLGPADLHIENDGNGFGADGSGVDVNSDGTVDAGTGNADSKITWGSYFRVTDLDVYIDIAGISLEGVEIKNTRGDLSGLDGTSSFGFAHSRRTIYAVNDAVIDLGVDASGNALTGTDVWVDGLALNTEFKGDIDIEALRFGGINEGESIGSIYLTDIKSDTRWTISAH